MSTFMLSTSRQFSQISSEFDLLNFSPCRILFLKNRFSPLKFTMMLGSHSSILTPFTAIWFTHSVIMSTAASRAACTISDTAPDDPAAVLFFILLTEFLTMPLSIKRGAPLFLPKTNYSYPMQTMYFKASSDNFSKLLSYIPQWLPVQYHHFLCTLTMFWPFSFQS